MLSTKEQDLFDTLKPRTINNYCAIRKLKDLFIESEQKTKSLREKYDMMFFEKVFLEFKNSVKLT